VGGHQPRRTRRVHRQGEQRLNAAAVAFDDSRRITGPHLLLPGPGATLETSGPLAQDAGALARWADGVRRAAAALGWIRCEPVLRPHASGCTLGLNADEDQLFTATEVNEWAWCAAIGDRAFHAPGHALADDEAQAFDLLRRVSCAERRPALMALLAAAYERELPVLLDDEAFSVGLGGRGQTWPLDALPALDAVPWTALGRIPTALVTGSNGKTTTVRLIAACLREHGLVAGHSCTDGLFIGAEALDSGDYSGPAGARAILRDPRVQAAVLETARGGMLRRGLALPEADVAVVTNISADHFGEYGVHDLDDLAAAKLSLARAVQQRGRLVLNADDPRLRAAGVQRPRVDWFTLDLDAALASLPLPADARVCGLRGEHLCWREGGAETVVLPITEIAIGLDGRARFNLANAAAATAAALVLGVPMDSVRAVLRDFGHRQDDNPGRLERRQFGGIEVLLDYAHNPDGLDGLLALARELHPEGRLGLLLGQAGNRDDEQVRALARAAARHRPDLVVLKDIDGMLRGRSAGELAGVLRAELLQAGLPEAALDLRLRELDSARAALAWAEHGDLLVLPVHAASAKRAVGALLDALEATGWQAGEPLPPP
jgi:UDP-N-acetylmuramyl tripeptide synthase